MRGENLPEAVIAGVPMRATTYVSRFALTSRPGPGGALRADVRAPSELPRSRLRGCGAVGRCVKQRTSTARGPAAAARNHRARSSLCPKRQIKAHFYYLAIVGDARSGPVPRRNVFDSREMCKNFINTYVLQLHLLFYMNLYYTFF